MNDAPESKSETGKNCTSSCDHAGEKTWEPNPFELYVNCTILKIVPGEGVWQSAVYLEPLGTDLQFWAEGSDAFLTQKHVVGKVVSATLLIQFSTVTRSEKKESIASIIQKGEFDRIKATGRFIGQSGGYLFFNSSFIISVFDEFCSGREHELEIGDWVDIEGSFEVTWNESTDVFAADRS